MKAPIHNYKANENDGSHAHTSGRASVDDEVMAIIAPILKVHHVTTQEWIDVRNTGRGIRARKEVTRLLSKLGWRTPQIARAIGTDPATVRRYLKELGLLPPAHRAPRAPRALPVLGTPPVSGPILVAVPGERRDCDQDSVCLSRLLASYPRNAPPEVASCPEGCIYFKAPDQRRRRSDASIGPGPRW